MRKLKALTHYTILATTPSLFAHKEHSIPPQKAPQTVSWMGECWNYMWGSQQQEKEWAQPTTYDEILQMLEDLESGVLEQTYSPTQLAKISDYIAALAKVRYSSK